jgi:hypothetical protein
MSCIIADWAGVEEEGRTYHSILSILEYMAAIDSLRFTIVLNNNTLLANSLRRKQIGKHLGNFMCNFAGVKKTFPKDYGHNCFFIEKFHKALYFQFRIQIRIN